MNIYKSTYTGAQLDAAIQKCDLLAGDVRAAIARKGGRIDGQTPVSQFAAAVESIGEYQPRPEWGDLAALCPTYGFVAVVTDEPPVDSEGIVFCFNSFFAGTVDWGDGTVETEWKFCHDHVYTPGTGQVDSQGNEFWIVKVSCTERTDNMNFVNGPDSERVGGVVSSLKYICFGGETVTGTITFGCESSMGHLLSYPHLEAIRMVGEHYHVPVLKMNQTVKHLIVDEGAVCTKLPNDALDNSIARMNRPLVVAAESDIYTDSVFYRNYDNEMSLDFSKVDSSARSVYRGFAYSRIRRVIFPSDGTEMLTANYSFQGNTQIEEIVFPDTMPDCASIKYMLSGTSRLKRLVLPADLGENVAKVDGTQAFSGCGYRGVIALPNTKFSVLHANGASHELCRIKGLSFSPQSPFDGAAPQLDISYSDIDGDDIRAILALLPDVSSAADGITRTVSIVGATGASDIGEETLASVATKGWTVTR